MILRCGYCACLGDYLRGLLGGCVVEKLLSRLRELCAVLGNEDERTLNFVAAVLDGDLARSNSVYLERLYGVLYGGERSVAYGVGVLRYRCDNVAGRGQLLAVFALVICAGCRLEAVSCPPFEQAANMRSAARAADKTQIIFFMSFLSLTSSFCRAQTLHLHHTKAL